MLKEFKEFAIKGNAVDLAVGVVIGAAFGGIVSSLVKDIIMPPIGLITGGLDFSNMFLVLKPSGATFETLAEANKAGAITWNYGNFITLGDQFPHRGLCDFHGRESAQQNEEARQSLRSGGERLPVLRDLDSDQGHALPALHLGNGRATRAPNSTTAAAIGRHPENPARRAKPDPAFRVRSARPCPPPKARKPA